MATRVIIEASVVSASLAFFLVHSAPGRKQTTDLVHSRPLTCVTDLLRSPEAVVFRDALSGALWCAALAAFFCILLIDSPIRPYVPLLFLLIVFAIAARFGAAAGSIGTAISAILFAEFLFEPFHRLAVSSPAERTNLGWMVIGGLAISILFGRSGESSSGQHQSARRA